MNALLQEGCRSLEEKEKRWEVEGYGCEVVKNLKEGKEHLLDLDTGKAVELNMARTLKVGVQRIRCDSCGSVTGGISVGTVYEEHGRGSYSSIAKRKEFPPFTPTRKVIDYINSEEPLKTD